MRINNYYLAPLGVSQAEAQPATEASGKESVASPIDVSSSHTASPELLRLVGLVQQQPEVRPTQVHQALDRLNQGLYATPASAQQTADALLKAAE